MALGKCLVRDGVFLHYGTLHVFTYIFKGNSIGTWTRKLLSLWVGVLGTREGLGFVRSMSWLEANVNPRRCGGKAILGQGIGIAEPDFWL